MTASMPELPINAVHYKRTPAFHTDSIPERLLADHTTKAGTWALIHVLKGRLLYLIPSKQFETVLIPGYPGVIEPETLHRVRPLSDVEFYIEFFVCVETEPDQIPWKTTFGHQA